MAIITKFNDEMAATLNKIAISGWHVSTISQVLLFDVQN